MKKKDLIFANNHLTQHNKSTVSWSVYCILRISNSDKLTATLVSLFSKTSGHLNTSQYPWHKCKSFVEGAEDWGKKTALIFMHVPF